MLIALILLLTGFIARRAALIVLGVAIGSIAGSELSLREHFAGYRSHTTLLAGTAAVITVGALYFVGGLILAICLGAGAVIFIGAFVYLRAAFRRAAGGVSFRVGRLRG